MNHTPLVARFLTEHASQQFCAPCLACALKIGLQAVRDGAGCLGRHLVILREGGISASVSLGVP